MQQVNPGNSTGIIATGRLPINFPSCDIHEGFVAAGAVAGTIWTPSASTLRFQILGWELSYTANATLSVGALVTVTLADGGTPIPGCSWQVYIPAAIPAGAGLFIVSRMVLPAGGKNSVAVNNALTLGLSTAIVGGVFQAIVVGLENSNIPAVV